MLDENIKSTLREHFEKIVHAVRIDASVDDTPASHEMLEMLSQLAELSPAISMQVWRDDAQRKPSFGLARQDEGAPATGSIRFAGAPSGHEFTSLVLAILHMGGHAPKEPPGVIEQARGIQGQLRFETYYSLSCQNCPDVVQALNVLAMSNPGISHEAIDGALFPSEVEDRQVMSVPAVFLNGKLFSQGRMSLEQILAKLDVGASDKKAKELNERPIYDVLVVGGGPAGVASAIYAARKGIRVGLLAERLGGQVLDTMDIENFISVPRTQGPRLAGDMQRHIQEYGVDVITALKATHLVPADAGAPHQVWLENEACLKARSVILAPGARWRQLGVPGEDEHRGRGVAYCPHCDGPLFKGKRVAVVGGGNSGIEAAIDLAGIASHVTIFEFDHQLRADKVLQDKLASLPNVHIRLGAETRRILGDNGKVSGLSWKDRGDGQVHDMQLDGVFVQIGLLPNTEWLQGAVQVSRRGEIVIDERCATSVPGIFAAGDATTVPYKQIIVAMGEGSKAALSAFDWLIRS